MQPRPGWSRACCVNVAALRYEWLYGTLDANRHNARRRRDDWAGQRGPAAIILRGLEAIETSCRAARPSCAVGLAVRREANQHDRPSGRHLARTFERCGPCWQVVVGWHETLLVSSRRTHPTMVVVETLRHFGPNGSMGRRSRTPESPLCEGSASPTHTWDLAPPLHRSPWEKNQTQTAGASRQRPSSIGSRPPSGGSLRRST